MDWSIASGVSAAVAVICLVIAGLIWTVGDQHTPRVVVALVIAGSVGLTGTPVGEWLHSIVGWLDTQAGSLIGQLTGEIVFGLVFLVVMYMLCIHVWKRKIDLSTLAFALSAPTAAVIVPGTVGVVALWIFTAIASIVGWPIAYLFALT